MPSLRILALLVAACPLALPAAEPPAPEPTREFEVRGELPYLGGQPVKLWGLRCSSALLSPAVTERLANNLDNMAAHGVNLIGVSMQGTNGGFPNVDAGYTAYTSDGRLEQVMRAADRRGMVVNLGLMMPRKDQLLADEAAIRRAVEETGRFLVARGLRNGFVNLFHEFAHPTRIDHELFREPDGATKRARVARWWKAVAPRIPSGMCPNHLSGAPPDYPGAEVLLIENKMPFPPKGFTVNVETDPFDQIGNEGVFNPHQLAGMRRLLERFKGSPRTAAVFHSPFVEGVTGVQGTGPNFETGGGGTGENDRGIRPFYAWMKANVGRWQYPRHVLP